jgi:hypothetical protein
MADREDWDAATRAQRHLAVAVADAELRRRHPRQHYPALRSAEPGPETDAERGELTRAVGAQPAEMGQLVTGLAAGHRAFADRLADRQSLTIPAEDPDYGDLGQAFLPWPGPGRTRSCSRPSPRSHHPADPAADDGPRRRLGSRRLTTWRRPALGSTRVSYTPAASNTSRGIRATGSPVARQGGRPPLRSRHRWHRSAPGSEPGPAIRAGPAPGWPPARAMPESLIRVVAII